MKIYSIYDAEFRPYGKVLQGYDTAELVEAMNNIPMPEAGTAYEPAIDSLEACAIFNKMSVQAYGGMPVQLGMCWGYNTKLNCLEYHRDSEVNIGNCDFVLLLAKQDEIGEDGMLDTACVKAFAAPAGVPVEVYATSLHYAPCQLSADGFRVAVVLPRGTNTAKPDLKLECREDTLLTACNKWLLAHAESSEAKGGAVVGLKGVNIDIAE
ncbi:MAG: DUF4867 family protein [Oscillospiraceae bacterium]|nr:DUF4867 family protein [Oscillospiraceae bacterium]